MKSEQFNAALLCCLLLLVTVKSIASDNGTNSIYGLVDNFELASVWRNPEIAADDEDTVYMTFVRGKEVYRCHLYPAEGHNPNVIRSGCGSWNLRCESLSEQDLEFP